jgi:putative endonuclease
MPRSPARNSAERRRAERRGRRAEALAALFLRLKLYSIREKRYKTPVGEIDLIASRFGTTVFVEVKARSIRGSEAAALQAVGTSRITRAAQYYLARHPALADTPLRFDVIFVAPRAWPRHVTNAFDAL